MIGKNVSLSETELLKSGNVAPFIILHGKTLQYSRTLGTKEIKISVSATDNFTVACAISIK